MTISLARSRVKMSKIQFSVRKALLLKSSSSTFKVYPCVLLIVIPNARFIGDCSRLKLKDNFKGSMRVLFKKIVSQFVASEDDTFDQIKKITALSLAPLHRLSFDGLYFLVM